MGDASAQRSLASLHELTERIADLLHVGSLTDYAGKDLLCPKDAPMYTPVGVEGRHQVVVLFGKKLIGDKISVEYAKRVVTLVKQIACGAVRPDTLVFTGGKDPGREVGREAGVEKEVETRRSFADGAWKEEEDVVKREREARERVGQGAVTQAAAGYLFFRSICEEVGVDADGFDYILEEESHTTKESMANVVKEVRARFGADAVSGCHFTLVSSDYHLIRIKEVHRTCPRHSLLFALEVASASWACIFAAYPFCVSPEPATAFLGRAMVLANDLSIVLVNLRGVISDRQFFARENTARLNATSAKMRDMFRVVDPTRALVRGGFRADMRSYSETLERAIHAVREVQELVAPLIDPCGSAPPQDLERAEELLTHAVLDMREQLDPDRVFRIADHIDVVDDLSAFVEMQGTGKASSRTTEQQPTISTTDIHDFPRFDRRTDQPWFTNGGGTVRGAHGINGEAGAGPAATPASTAQSSSPSSSSHQQQAANPHDPYAGAHDLISAPVIDPRPSGGVAVMHKRIARDGPHLILVDGEDDPEPPQRSTNRRPRAKRSMSDTRKNGSASPASSTPTAPVASSGDDKQASRAAPRKAAPRRRKATGAVGKTASTAIGSKRKTPVKRTTGAQAGASASKTKSKVPRSSSPKA